MSKDIIKKIVIWGIVGTIGIVIGSVYLHRHIDYSPRIEKALVKNNFKRAHRVLEKQFRQAQYLEGEERYIRLEQTYELSAQKVFQKEVEFLLNEHSNMAIDRIASLAREYGLIASPYIGVTDLDEVFTSNEFYNKSATKFNLILDNLVDHGLSTNNAYLVEKVIPLYKPILDRKMYESHLFRNNEYTYFYTYEAREQAAAMYHRFRQSKGLEGRNQVVDTYIARPVAPPTDTPTGDGTIILLVLLLAYAITLTIRKKASTNLKNISPRQVRVAPQKKL